MFNLRMKDDISIISEEASLFSLECLYDDVATGILDGSVKSGYLSLYVATEDTDDGGVIGALRHILDIIWGIIKSVVGILKKIFMIIYRYFTTKKHVENMKSFEDVIVYIIKCYGIDDEVDVLKRWISRNDDLFKFIHMGLIFTEYMDAMRVDERFRSPYQRIQDTLNEDKENVSHDKMFITVIETYSLCKTLIIEVNKYMYKDRLAFIQSETGNKEGTYAELTVEGWSKLKEISTRVASRVESTRSFILQLSNLVDRTFSEIESRIDTIKAELAELEQAMGNSLLSSSDKNTLQVRKNKLRVIFNQFNEMMKSFGALRQEMMDNSKSRVSTANDADKQYGINEILTYSDRALEIIIQTFVERNMYDAKRVDLLKDIVIKNIKDEIAKARPNPSSESVMFDMLFTSDMLPAPDFDVPEVIVPENVYESAGLSSLLSQIEYQDTVNNISYYMEEVGLDASKVSDVVSFRNQIPTSLAPIDKDTVDDEHKLTKTRISKRRYLIISSIKMLIEAINSIRDSLYKTVMSTRADLSDLTETIPFDERQDTKVTIPASLVKSIYSHNYNKIIELLVDSRTLKFDGELNYDSVDVDELNERLKNLMFNRRKYFDKVDIEVPLNDVLATLRGKLAAFEVILLKSEIKPLDVKIPTTEELENYQKYLVSLISLLRTDVIGTVVATKSLINDYYGGVA